MEGAREDWRPGRTHFKLDGRDCRVGIRARGGGPRTGEGIGGLVVDTFRSARGPVGIFTGEVWLVVSCGTTLLEVIIFSLGTGLRRWASSASLLVAGYAAGKVFGLDTVVNARKGPSFPGRFSFAPRRWDEPLMASNRCSLRGSSIFEVLTFDARRCTKP